MEGIQEFINNLGPLGTTIWNFIVAVGLIVIGIIVGRLLAGLVRRLLRRTNLDNRLASSLQDEQSTEQPGVEEIISKVVFWIIMLFFIVGALQRLNLPGVAAPLQSLLTQITTNYLPRLGGAALLLLVAWGVATVLRYLVRRGANLLRLDQRLSQHGALEEGESVSLGESLATAVFWFIFLLFLPAVLDTLGINTIAAPIQAMFTQVFTYIPNIAAAAVTLLIGWFIARIIRQVVTNLLAAVGADNVGERLGLRAERSLSKLVGTLLYTFILLLTLVSALESLNIEAISGPATLMLNTLINALPNLFGAVLVLVISYFIGRLIANLIVDLLRGVGFDTLPEKLGLNWGTRPPSAVTGTIIIVAIMLIASLSAAELLGSQFLADILATFIGFGGQLVLALIIFAIGLYLANLAHNLVLATGGARANFTATLARVAILVLTTAMALRQLGIADDIVNLAFGILLGALGIAAALAFGLGSREIAGQEVARILANFRDESDDSG